MSTEPGDEIRTQVQERLALFTKIWAALILIASAVTLGFYEVNPDKRPPAVVHAVAALGVVTLGGLWYVVVHRGRRGLRTLHLMDELNLGVIGSIYAVSSYFSVARIPSAPWTGFIFVTFVAFSRVTIIPSSPRRTAIATSFAYVPLVVSAFFLTTAPIVLVHDHNVLPMTSAAYVGFLAFLSAVAVVLCALSSRVIFGLRRQIDEATRLGQYTLERKIGEGAMGMVYRARHALLRRPTAIKILRGADVRRFEREVQLLSRLTHPNTVAVYDYGRTGDGVFYYVMELLDGMDLDRVVKRFGPLPPGRVLRILAQTCGSLEEAHAMGLIHRDIKPANIILCRRGLVVDVVKVVDFGLVKEIATDAQASSVIAGTPHFIAPEAIVDPASAGPASDLYSLGATAYTLLTGKKVFEGRTVVELYAQHATAAPVPPSRHADRAIPGELEALVMACLAKDPAARPAGAGALRRALDAIAVDDWDDTRAEAWWRDLDTAALEVSVDPAVTVRTMTVDLRARQPGRTDQET